MTFKDIKPLLKGKEKDIWDSFNRRYSGQLAEFKTAVRMALQGNGIWVEVNNANTYEAILNHCERKANY